MIANFFNKTKHINIISIVMFLFFYYTTTFFLLSNYEFSTLFLVKKIGSFLGLILFVFIVNFIIRKNNLTQDNSYALLLIVLLLGTFSEAMISNNIVFTNITLLLGFRKIYSLKSDLNTKRKLFDAGFWIGISTLLYAWSIIYVWLIFTGIVIFRKISVKNLIIPIVGLAAPLLIYFSYNFYFDTLAIFYDKFTFDYSLIFNSYNKLPLAIPILFFLAILVWSVVTVTPKVVLISTKLKFSWNVLLNHLLTSIMLVVLAPIKNGSEMLFLLFPSAIIITNLLQKSKSKTFKNIILYMFLIISLGVYFL